MSILEAKKPENVKVITLMSSKVMKIKGENSIPHVAQAFRNHHISSAPVVNDENEIIGFVTLGDSLKCIRNDFRSMSQDLGEKITRTYGQEAGAVRKNAHLRFSLRITYARLTRP